ncbi:NAD-dependent epimerase/dehydratase family protein, partial [bacterium]|nr:NAD-dependent epimerase/dehydratase family protein [bacterium]
TRGNRMPADMAPHIHIQGDRSNIDDLNRAAQTEKWDAVIDNLAFNAKDVSVALQAFQEVGHYVLNSTVAVYRFIPGQYPAPYRDADVDFEYHPPEEDPKNIHWKYARGKLMAEKACRNQETVPWTILRPAVVYGPEDPTQRGFWYLSRLLKGGPLLLADGGVQSFQIAYSVDIARAFVQAVENRKKTEGKSYFLAQKELITLKDFVSESAHALGILPDWVDIPAAILKEMKGPYGDMINLAFDTAPAREDFGFETTPWPEVARITAEWFRDHWQGEDEDLLATREAELQLAARWKSLLNVPWL